MSEKRFRERKKERLSFHEYEERKSKEKKRVRHQTNLHQSHLKAKECRALDLGYDRLTNTKKKIEMIERCPYCGSRVILIDEKELFPNSQRGTSEKYYSCSNNECDAYCRTTFVDGEYVPMGNLADSNLRALRTETHKIMDQLLTLEVYKTRREMYAYFCDYFGIRMEEMHIAMFDTYKCQKVIELTIGVMEKNLDKCKGKVKYYKRSIPTYIDKTPELKERLQKICKGA